MQSEVYSLGRGRGTAPGQVMFRLLCGWTEPGTVPDTFYFIFHLLDTEVILDFDQNRIKKKKMWAEAPWWQIISLLLVWTVEKARAALPPQTCRGRRASDSRAVRWGRALGV